MEQMTDFISSVSSDIPFHISRFFPRYRMKNAEPTEMKSMMRFKTIADRKLRHVYLGNV
jgi:pyruvate formate lyase activating enzyme